MAKSIRFQIRLNVFLFLIIHRADPAMSNDKIIIPHSFMVGMMGGPAPVPEPESATVSGLEAASVVTVI